MTLWSIKASALMVLVQAWRPALCSLHFCGSGQFSQEDAAKTFQVARARVRVERAIQRMKLFRMPKSPLPWETSAIVDEMMIVIAGVNLSAPVLK